MNPFADYGRIIHGDRFIGRKVIVSNIENRIIHPNNPGNLAIIGMHRIGKSSLARKVIIEQKDNLTKKGILPIWMGVAPYDDVWPIWRKTEKALREVITTTMSKTYGNDWINELEKGRSNLKKIFDVCRQAQLKEEHSFGDRASQNLIDFTYPADLFTIILARGLWEPNFQPLFEHNRNYWEQRKQLLSKCRNPLAHNRDETLKPYEVKTVEAYCEEILTVLADYRY